MESQKTSRRRLCVVRINEVINLNIKHGLYNTKLYRIWSQMKTRCYNPNSDSYKYYGARGIQICDEWKNSIERFYNWAINNGYQDGLTIERINIDGNYDPINCCWATPKQQARNTSRTKYVNYNGQNMSLAEACELANMNYNTVNNRLYKLHWDFEKAISEPIINCDQITYHGITKPLKTWAKELNLNYNAVRLRIVRRGWPIDKAFTTPVREMKRMR